MLRAAHAHRDLEIDVTSRIDVFRAIEDAELILAFEPMPNLSGAYYRNAGVLINANHPLARQRYTAAHEFGHHLFKHGTSVDPMTDPLARWGGQTHWPDHEKQAEAFAAWFLMPKKLVNASLDQLGLKRPGSAQDVYSLALRLGTSYEATARHLPNLKLGSQTQRDGWLKAKPRELKLALAEGAPPKDMRNDVWRIDERDNGAVVAVRIGDRLVIELRDVPSSGYQWLSGISRSDVRVVADSFKDALPQLDLLEEAADEVDGADLVHIFVVEIDHDAEANREPVKFRRVRPWTADVVDTFELDLDIQRPRIGISEEMLRIAA